MAVIDEVAAERNRQIKVEGWSVEHDDQHTDRSLAYAGACYALHCAGRAWLCEEPYKDAERYRAEELPDNWPTSWAEEWWKPKNPRRDLIRAAALIVAEIERMDRAGGRG